MNLITVEGEFNAFSQISKGSTRRSEKNSKMKKMDRDKQRYLKKQSDGGNSNEENKGFTPKWSGRNVYIEEDDEGEGETEDVEEVKVQEVQEVQEVQDGGEEWIPDEELIEKGAIPWNDLPLWIPETIPNLKGFHDTNCTKAIEAGLSIRPLSETITDTLEWIYQYPERLPLKAGPNEEQEARLLGL